MSESDRHTFVPFTLRQRRGLIALLILFLCAIAIGLLRNRSFVADPIPNEAMRYLELQDRIDPNEADVALLAALPALGERRAQDIVNFRESRRVADPKRIVFREPNDLLQIRGIGGGILAQVRPFLRFPDSPTTQP